MDEIAIDKYNYKVYNQAWTTGTKKGKSTLQKPFYFKQITYQGDKRN